ncbi:hypothetical protein [Arthrobacter sp. UYCo732]|uniref:hypothetical protein n=1 Tax=Arthrobacter sp. UYCo732 TaxID=3156336 RepID=UPI0033943F8A
MKQITAPPLRSRRVMALIVGIAAVLAIAGGFAVFLATHGSNQPRASEIPRYVPADADTVVVAPYTASWWSKVGAMAPQELMLPPAQTGDALPIENIGYSRSPDIAEREVANTGPLRIFYVEAPSDSEAATVQQWLDNAPGYDYRTVHRHGRVLAVTPVWVTDYPAPSQSITASSAFTADVTDSQASMWFSPEREVTTLTGGADTEAAKALRSTLEHGFGFAAGTAWTGTSKDGDSWEGSFPVGGVRTEQVDFAKASSALMETRKVLAQATGPLGKNSQTSYQVTDPGPSAVLAAASIKIDGKDGALGVSGQPAAVKAVPGASLTAVVDVTAWNRAASGDVSETESILTRAMSASGDQMNMEFTYAPTTK